MAITSMIGFETADSVIDTLGAGGSPNLGLAGSAAYATNIVRTGTRSLRVNPGSGASGSFNSPINGTFLHFGLYVASLPSVQRLIAGNSSSTLNLRLETTGALSVYDTTTLMGTSTTTLNTATWYWIGFRRTTGTSVVYLQINFGNEVTGTSSNAGTSNTIGAPGTEASAIDLYFDDVITDSAGFIASSNVNLLLPISDNAAGTGWVLGDNSAEGGTGWSNIDNTPPVGVADLGTGSATGQIRNATSSANSNFDANLTTYATAGVGASDTVLAVQEVVVTAAPVSTSAKQGTFGISSNPVIANVALGTGGVSGAFWSGTAAGTYATGWKISFGALTTSPTVTVGSSPVARITQVTSSTRIAMVCFMALYVAWTPAAVAAGQIPYTNPMLQLLPQ